MRALSGFALTQTTPQGLEAPPRSRLLHEGRDTGTTLPGAVLEGQFEVDDRYLLLVTDDVPYEEILRFYLMDRSFEVIDKLELGAPYTPGVVTDLVIAAERELEFSFPADRWRLRVRRAKGLLKRHYLELQPGV